MKNNSGITLNLLCLIGLGIFLVYNNYVISLDAPLKVTALDRAGVINEDQLRDSFPELAGDVRRELGLWITEKQRSATDVVVLIAAAVAIINLGLHIVGRVVASQKALSGAAGEKGST